MQDKRKAVVAKLIIFDVLYAKNVVGKQLYNCKRKFVIAYEEIINGQDTEWLILGYNDTRDKISLYSKGSHGLEGLRSNLKDEVLYGFIRIENKFVLLTYVSEQVSGVRRARALVHGRAVGALFKQAHQIQISASTPNDLSEANVRNRLKLGEPDKSSSIPKREAERKRNEELRSKFADLEKSGKFWKRRFFELRGKTLYLFRDENDKLPISKLELDGQIAGVTDAQSEVLILNSFKVDFKTSEAYYFFSDDKKDKESIVTAIGRYVK
ncbi:10983_t:CDS:2 [Entrophospora sp. SA101]|nr:10983_t:CDS:2 [Entrophospora sp. SA101]